MAAAASGRSTNEAAGESTTLLVAGSISPSQTQEQNSNKRNYYRGGFSTSICSSLFANPRRHNDCCALACCGVLSSDKSRYLLLDRSSEQLPLPPWWRRILGNLVLPICLFLSDRAVIDAIDTAITTSKCEYAFPADGSGPYLDVFNASTTSIYYDNNASSSSFIPTNDGEPPDYVPPPKLVDDINSLLLAHRILQVSFIVVAVFLLLRAANHRYKFRSLLISKLYEIQMTNQEARNAAGGNGLIGEGERQIQIVDSATAATKLHKSDTRQATKICGCYRAPDDDPQLTARNGGITEGGGPNIRTGDSSNGDLCTCLWRFLSNLFCAACCGCWCMCCGMCAIGQEQREVEKMMLLAELQQQQPTLLDTANNNKASSSKFIDYITFQPFMQYFQSIENLREIGNGTFVSHYKSMSRLSKHLIRAICIAILAVTVYALTGINQNFAWPNLCIFYAVLFQSVIILYLVHWMWNRHDISLDSVVKLFGSGFVLSTSTAFVVEMLVSVGVAIVTGVLGFIALIFEVASLESTDDPKEHIPLLIKEIAWLGILAVALQAFVVAALTEELCKYFGFWMVETPDLLTEDDRRKMKSLAGGEQLGEGSVVVSTTMKRRDLNSKGAAITIGMISTAVGFACCENVQYVFSSSDVSVEFGTLVARSIFPVHALAAAIQSIGVCRRDLEGDSTWQLGRIILPALMLHGCFDFFLMAAPVVSIVSHVDDIVGKDGNNDYNARYNAYLAVCSELGAVDENVWKPIDDGRNGEDAMSQLTDLIITIVSIGLSTLTVVWGCVYYVVQSRKQRARLVIIDDDQLRLRGSTAGLFADVAAA